MRYKFRAVDIADEIKSAVGGILVSVAESNDEIILDFGVKTLTAGQKTTLTNLMQSVPLLRGKVARFAAEGTDLVLPFNP